MWADQFHLFSWNSPLFHLKFSRVIFDSHSISSYAHGHTFCVHTLTHAVLIFLLSPSPSQTLINSLIFSHQTLCRNTDQYKFVMWFPTLSASLYSDPPLLLPSRQDKKQKLRPFSCLHTCQPSRFPQETPVFHCPPPVSSRFHISPVFLPIYYVTELVFNMVTVHRMSLSTRKRLLCPPGRCTRYVTQPLEKLLSAS